MYKAAVFDLDGTLFHTIPDIAEAMNRALVGSGLPLRDESDFNYIIGGGAMQCVVNACPEGTDKLILLKVFEDFQAIYDEEYCKDTMLYSGIEPLITQLRAKGIRLAVVTNKTESTAVKIINRFFTQHTFEYILGNSNNYPPKPQPELGRYLCGLMGIEPSQVLYLGDSGSDMVFGNSAGFYPVGVLWGYRPKSELIKSGAAALLNKPDELMELINRADAQL